MSNFANKNYAIISILLQHIATLGSKGPIALKYHFERGCANLLMMVFTGLLLSGCNTIAPNSLSAADTAALNFTSVEVIVPTIARIHWPAMEDQYVQSHGYTVGDPKPLQTPEARAFLAEQASQRLKAALEHALADRQGGTRPVRLVATLIAASIPSVAQRIVIGGRPVLAADIEIIDARSGKVMTSYRGGVGTRFTGQGLNVLVDSAMIAGGWDDLFEGSAKNFANDFKSWLTRN